MPITSRTSARGGGRFRAADPAEAGAELGLSRTADVLAGSGLCVCRDFIEASTVRELAAECRSQWSAAGFHAARIGRASRRMLRSEIRGDYIRWLGEDEARGALSDVLARMDALRFAINRRTYLGLFDLECHFACYPAGAVYGRHLDSFCDGNRRVVSWVLYLNERWSVEDGGELRLYPETPTSGGNFLDVPPVGGDYLDVPPVGGTLVTFLSAEYEHEVLPATRERISLAGWFRARQ